MISDPLVVLFGSNEDERFVFQKPSAIFLIILFSHYCGFIYYLRLFIPNDPLLKVIIIIF